MVAPRASEALGRMQQAWKYNPYCTDVCIYIYIYICIHIRICMCVYVQEHCSSTPSQPMPICIHMYVYMYVALLTAPASLQVDRGRQGNRTHIGAQLLRTCRRVLPRLPSTSCLLAVRRRLLEQASLEEHQELLELPRPLRRVGPQPPGQSSKNEGWPLMRRPDLLGCTNVRRHGSSLDMCMCGVYVWAGGMGTTCKASATKSCFAIMANYP